MKKKKTKKMIQSEERGEENQNCVREKFLRINQIHLKSHERFFCPGEWMIGEDERNLIILQLIIEQLVVVKLWRKESLLKQTKELKKTEKKNHQQNYLILRDFKFLERSNLSAYFMTKQPADQMINSEHNRCSFGKRLRTVSDLKKEKFHHWK